MTVADPPTASASTGQGRREISRQLPRRRGVGDPDQEGAVTEAPPLPDGDGLRHARAGAITLIPTSAMAVRTAVAMATAPGESPWMHSVSTQSVSTEPSCGDDRAAGQGQRLGRRRPGVRQHRAGLRPVDQAAVGSVGAVAESLLAGGQAVAQHHRQGAARPRAAPGPHLRRRCRARRHGRSRTPRRPSPPLRRAPRGPSPTRTACPPPGRCDRAPRSCRANDAPSSARSMSIGLAAEAGAVGVGGMGADPDVVLQRGGHGGLHGRRRRPRGRRRRRAPTSPARAASAPPPARPHRLASPTSALRSMVRWGATPSAGLELVHHDAVAVHHALVAPGGHAGTRRGWSPSC